MEICCHIAQASVAYAWLHKRAYSSKDFGPAHSPTTLFSTNNETSCSAIHEGARSNVEISILVKAPCDELLDYSQGIIPHGGLYTELNEDN
jgi:hypothetical protein